MQLTRYLNQLTLTKIYNTGLIAQFLGVIFQATGCEADFMFEEKIHNPTEHNKQLGAIYAKHAASFGIEFTTDHTAINSHTGK